MRPGFMILHPISSGPVHFEGDWTEAETDVIETEVVEAEKRLATDPDAASWVAIHHATQSTDMFAISRIGIPGVIQAQSFPGLIEKIQSLDLSDTVRPLLSR